MLAYLGREQVRAPEDQRRGARARDPGRGLRVRLDEVADLFASGAFTRAQADRASRSLRAELDEVEARMVATRSRSALASLPSDPRPWRPPGKPWTSKGRRAVLFALPLTITLDPPGRGVRAFDPATVRVDWDA